MTQQCSKREQTVEDASSFLGKTVELGSCNTGKGVAPAAQALADELTKQSCKQTKVVAPKSFAWFYSSGKVVPAVRKTDGSLDDKSRWMTFEEKP